MTNEVIAAMIEAAGIIMASLFTALSVIFAAGRVTSRHKLKQDLIASLRDNLALYAIEEAQIRLHPTSNKIAIRKQVEEQAGLILSNKFTPARAKRKLLQLESMSD